MTSWLVALVVALVGTPLLAAVARGAWLDVPTDADRARKPQARGVPAIGGVVLLVALGAAALVEGRNVFALDARFPFGASVTALGLAFALGAWDDRRVSGLGWGTKLAGQFACTLPLGLAAATAGDPLGALAWMLAGVAAMNCANTFDNHDGALAGLGVLGLGTAGACVWGAALLGFLPWNLNARRSAGSGAVPTAYLGDSGSHLLGLAALLVPGGLWLLVLPALDLARLSVERTRRGSRPWVGDRRHLAHRLAGRGLARPAVIALLVAVAAPAAIGGHEAGRAPLVGLALTLALFLAVVRATRSRA